MYIVYIRHRQMNKVTEHYCIQQALNVLLFGLLYLN